MTGHEFHCNVQAERMWLFLPCLKACGGLLTGMCTESTCLLLTCKGLSNFQGAHISWRSGPIHYPLIFLFLQLNLLSGSLYSCTLSYFINRFICNKKLRDLEHLQLEVAVRDACD